MTDSNSLENVTSDNKQSLRRLARAISLSQGQFSLILVCCKYPHSREQVVNRLKELSSVEIQQLVLPASVNTLYTTLDTALEDKQPEALIVFGLDSVVAINQVITSTNLVRDEFRKRFEFPLVLWVSEEVLQKLIRLAPDFKSFAATSIRLDLTNNQLMDWGAITA